MKKELPFKRFMVSSLLENKKQEAMTGCILYGMPFCPFSRKIAFGLREKGIFFKEILEKTWSPSEAVFHLNDTGELPVLKDNDIVCSNDYVAYEYLEEAYPQPCLLGVSLIHRLEGRKWVSWWDKIFYHDVYLSIFYERAIKPHHEKKGPDTKILKTGRNLLAHHLIFLNSLMEGRTYFNSHSFSWADMAAASHLSCLDYLGEMAWDKIPYLKEWYMKIKSRPSFRLFLQQTFPGLAPSSWYPCLDF